MDLFENLQKIKDIEEYNKYLESLEIEDDDLSDEEAAMIIELIKKHENEPTYSSEEVAKELGFNEV